MKYFIQIVILATKCIITKSSIHHYQDGRWSYMPSSKKGPDSWSSLYPKCGNTDLYSPIDLSYDKSNYSGELKPAKLEGHWIKDRKPSVSLTFENSYLVLTFHPNSEIKLTGLNLRSSLNDSKYILNKCFLHWGASSQSDGSEHNADFREFHMEMQCEFRQSTQLSQRNENRNQKEPKKGFDHRLMVSTFVTFIRQPSDLGMKKNRGWAQLLKQVKRFVSEVTTKVVFKLTLNDFLQMLSPDWSSYYMYEGSMTTPPCRPNITWYIFTEPVIVAEHLSQYLYQLNSQSHDAANAHFTVTGNTRPSLKHYKTRKVLRSFGLTDNIIRIRENQELFDQMMQVLMSPESRAYLKDSSKLKKKPPGKPNAFRDQKLSAAYNQAYNENKNLENQLRNLSHSKLEVKRPKYNITLRNHQKMMVAAKNDGSEKNMKPILILLSVALAIL